MPGIHVKSQLSPDDFLADLTLAAYWVALRQGFKGSFVDYQQRLEEALREVIRRDMFVSDLCGLMTVCQEANRYEPWTPEAEKVYQDAA